MPMPTAVPVSVTSELAKAVPVHFGIALDVRVETVELPSLLLKFVQSDEARNPLVEALACGMESVPDENESGPEKAVEETTPETLVERSAEGVPMVRLVVDAVPKKPSPETEKTVDEAVVRLVCAVWVEDALSM